MSRVVAAKRVDPRNWMVVVDTYFQLCGQARYGLTFNDPRLRGLVYHKIVLVLEVPHENSYACAALAWHLGNRLAFRGSGEKGGMEMLRAG